MMRITDTATQLPSNPESKAVESIQALPTIKGDRPHPLPQPSGTSYAVRLLAITSTVGVSAVLLGQGLWQPDTNAARLPTSEGVVMRNSLPALRDRVSVTTFQSAAMSPPESLPAPINATRQNQLEPSTALPTVRISHGFSKAGQPPLTATLSAPPSAQTLPPPQILPPIAVEPSSPAVKQPPMNQADQTATVIAALLEAPKPRALETQPLEPQTLDQTATIASRTKAPTEIPSTHDPSQTTLIGGRDASEQTAPTGLPVPAATSMQLASAMRETAIEQTRTSDEGIYLKLLTITGNTRFSSKELVDVVQKAIAAHAERLSASNQPGENHSAQWSLRQASEAITQFYAAHGYTNVKVDISTAAFNGATPEIRIVEDTPQTNRLSPP